MFSFFRTQKKTLSSLGELLHTDMHSHLLDGIDDGSPDIKTSIELIKGLQELGYKKIITTPHTMQGLYPNTSETILSKQKNLNLELRKAKVDVEIEAASEYMMDINFEKLIEDDDILSFGKERYVLIEMSFVAPSMNYEQIIFDLRTRNYTPVLAHPERYNYWHKKPEKFLQIIDSGCLLQVNLLSLAGYYGKDIKKVAIQFLQNNQVSFLGTDLHHAKHLKCLQKNSEECLKLIDGHTFLNTSI